MCWNWEVSLFFAVLETSCIAFVWYITATYPKRYRKKYKRSLPWIIEQHRDRIYWLMPFMITINVVEWSEVGIWLSSPDPIDVLSNQADACAQCSYGNFFFTSVAGFAIGFQPIFTVMFLYKTHMHSIFHRILNRQYYPELSKKNEEIRDLERDGEENGLLDDITPSEPQPDPLEETNYILRTRSIKPEVQKHLDDDNSQKKLFELSNDTFFVLWICVVSFTIIVFLTWLSLTLFPSISKCTYDPSEFATMAASCTCSYEGIYGHLVWTFMFPCKIRNFLPTIFDYLMYGNIAPFFYAPCWMAVPFIGSFYFFLVELAWYMGSPEVYSVWCWTGVGAVSLHILYGLMIFDETLLHRLELAGMNGSSVEVAIMFIKVTYLGIRDSKPTQNLIAKTKRKFNKFFCLR